MEISEFILETSSSSLTTLGLEMKMLFSTLTEAPNGSWATNLTLMFVSIVVDNTGNTNLVKDKIFVPLN